VKNEIKAEYKQVARYVLYHQMFSEPNIIRDRRNMLKIPIQGSAKIIHKMLSLMLKNIRIWHRGEEKKFIKKLSKKLGLNYQKIWKKYQERLSFLLDDQKQDQPAKLMLVYCDMLTTLLDKTTEKTLKNLYQRVSEQISYEKFTDILTDLPAEKDGIFNIIINLAILRKYSEIINESYPEQYFNEYSKILFDYLQEEIN
jgi:hypothetical protein